MICPQCGSKIECLEADFITQGSLYRIDRTGVQEFVEEFSLYLAEQRREWSCPECWAELARTEEEAIELLNKSELELKIDKVLSEENGP